MEASIDNVQNVMHGCCVLATAIIGLRLIFDSHVDHVFEHMVS